MSIAQFCIDKKVVTYALSGGMLLASVGEEQAAAAVDRAVERYLETASPKELPRELGGEASTRQVGEAVVAQL